MFKLLRITIVLLLAGTGTAQASTARVYEYCEGRAGDDCSDFLGYDAAPGERNVVLVEETGASVILRDTGASITTGAGCIAIADGVRCTRLHPYRGLVLDVDLGDGDDAINALQGPEGENWISGGPGDDRITGNGMLVGGPGNDIVTGSGTFYDADGAKPGHDIYRGTGIDDHLSYDHREDGVRVDLRPGRRSEDRISGIHDVAGGSGDDVLIGGDSADTLDGGPGNDQLFGMGGDDHLRSEDLVDDVDTIDGGSGNDRIDGSIGPARIRCGPGRDSVTTQPLDVVADDCELLWFGLPKSRLRAKLPTAKAAFVLSLPDCGKFCSADRWRATAYGRVVASVSVVTHPANLRLNAVGRRLLRQHHKLTLRIERLTTVSNAPEDMNGGLTLTIRLR